MTKKFDTLTFYLFLISFTVLITTLGCETFQRLGTALTTPNPATGGATPGEQLTEGVLGVALNPASWPSWGKIVGALVAVGGAVWGTSKVARSRRK